MSSLVLSDSVAESPSDNGGREPTGLGGEPEEEDEYAMRGDSIDEVRGLRSQKGAVLGKEQSSQWRSPSYM